MTGPAKLPAEDLRNLSMELISSVVPSRAGDPWFENELCQGRTNDRGYNPGPELCHWLLWKLGCRDSRILSRDVPELNLQHSNRGTERIALGAQRLTAWRPFRLDDVPNRGDILHMGSIARGEPEHVCIFMWVDGDKWITADVLPCERKGHFQAALISRRLQGDKVIGRSGETKRLNAWVDITRLMFDVSPSTLP